MSKSFWYLILLLGPGPFFGMSQEFRINLAGYKADTYKKALYLKRTEQNTESFQLISIENPELTFDIIPKKSLSNWKPFEASLILDFSFVKSAGHYLLKELNSGIESTAFEIGDYPDYQEDVIAFMQSQRCGFNPYINGYCHQNDGLSFFGQVPDSSKIDARGGWHDAGDQLKYLITGSNATARMLQAWLAYPQNFKDLVLSNGLTGENKIPDIIDEAKWGTDWILNLHAAPGELYHQVADDRDHRGFKLPQNDNADYGWGKNSFRPVYAATGEPQGLGKYKSKATGVANLAGRSAAALALGYQVYSRFESLKKYADTCLLSAKELYEMGKNKEGYQQGNSYGAPYRYEENTWADDMEWAAAELYKVTKEKRYLIDARKYADIINTWSWMERDTASHYEMYPFVNMGHFALWQAGSKKDKKKMVSFYQHNLQKIKERADQNPYGVGHLFIWCSNNLAAAVATQCLLYEEMSGDNSFRDLMQNEINWLLGINPWGTSMITGLPQSADWPLDVHMPFWKLENKVVKGSLVDGPILSTIHDKMLAITLSEPDEYADFQPDHIRYHDDFADYSTNEPTMDGSADLILILTYLNSKK